MLLKGHYEFLHGFSAISFLSQIIGISPWSASCLPPEYTVKKPSLGRQHRGRKRQTNTRGTGCAPKYNKPLQPITNKMVSRVDWIVWVYDFMSSLSPKLNAAFVLSQGWRITRAAACESRWTTPFCKYSHAEKDRESFVWLKGKISFASTSLAMAWM